MRVDLTDPDMPDWRKYLFTCDADDHHWLLFEWWDDDCQEETWAGTLDVVPTTYAPRLRQRIVTAAKVLFGRRVWTTDCVLLNEATTDAAPRHDRSVMVHVEQMDDRCWYIGIDMPDGTSWTGNFTGRGYMTFAEQENDGIVWDADDTHESKAADSE